MIDCTEAVSQLWDYIENNLEADNEAEMEEHLSFCRTCCGEVDFAEEMRTMMKSSAKPDIPTEVADRLGAFIDDLEESSS